MKKLAVVTGLIVVVALGVYLVVALTGNTDKTLDLTGSGSACTIGTSAADKDVQVKKNKKVTWTVKNACASAQTVTLGNFRTVQTSNQTTCTNPTEGGAVWPFKDQDQNNRSVTVPAGSTGEIVLQEAKNDGTTQLTYYFDICLGSVKADPRLIIDP
jgi:hypothetical protein